MTAEGHRGDTPMRRAVVTGATGAIGRALCAELVDAGYEVLVLTNPVSARAARMKRDHGATDAIVFDDCGIECLGDYHQDTKDGAGRPFDVFFHLAWDCTFGVARDDCHAQQLNIGYAVDAAELAARLGCSVFVGVGSQAEYGCVEGSLTPDTPVHPDSGYGMAKLAAGQLTRLRCRQLGIRHEWVRVLSVYGPYDASYTMVSSTLSTLLEGGVPQLTPCEQMWDYLYSGDAAHALRLVAERGCDGAVYCLGSGDARPLREYVYEMRDAVDPSLPLGIGGRDYSDNQVMFLQADIGLLRQDTGFVPSISFEDGIRMTVAHMCEMDYSRKEAVGGFHNEKNA